jgi:DNA-directed RNA polymerase specialized sigma24 family protein
MSEEPITEWITQLKAGEEAGAERIWEFYFERLARLARKKLDAATRRVADEEDAALSALNSFCHGAAEGRFPRLADRDDLWKLLLTITERKAIGQAKHEHRQKRGGGKVRGDSLFIGPDDDNDGALDKAFAAREPTPQFAAELAEQMQRLFSQLPKEVLAQVATMKVEGFTNDEIASRLGCSERSVKRKLQLIRKIWSAELT